MSVYRRETHVKLAYELELEDLTRAQRLQRKLVLGKTLPGPSGVLLLVCAAFFWRLPVVGALVASGAVTAFVVWLMWWVLVRVPRQNIERSWDERRAQRLEVNDEAFSIHDSVSGKRVSWDFVVFWRETEHDFLLFVEGGLYHLIPKRVLGGAAVETSLRRLLEDHVAAGGAARLAAATKGGWATFVIYIGVMILLLGTVVEALGVLVFG